MSTPDLELERRYVVGLYRRLDEVWHRAARRRATRDETAGTPQAVGERDAAVAFDLERLAQLRAAERGLCFGRLDLADGERHYVGRIGLRSEDHEPLLLDWRAPAARPFYTATAASPEGVRRRRHLHLRGRQVVGLTDEVLSIDAGAAVGDDDSALLAALAARRSGRMRDVVATIQTDQDRIIRDDARGILVVQGGPGTGKSVVALHRVAYLLYTHRERLSRSGVLVVGPHRTFLDYVSEVLPALGETSVVFATVDGLLPGVTATRPEPVATAALKGRPAMADVLAAAVADRQEVPDRALELVVDDHVLRLEPTTVARARRRARASGLPHNRARRHFVAGVLDALVAQEVQRLAADVGDADLVAETVDAEALRAKLRRDRSVRAALQRLWPRLTPQRLLDDLFASPERLAAAAPQLIAREQQALLRRPLGTWTPADVPLLDEAAELLGPLPTSVAAQRRAEGSATAYAQGVLDVLTGSRAHEHTPGESLLASDVVTADALAERHDAVDDRSAAERAAVDRTWAYGHVVVDEAQELSAMAWRMLLRRCPSRSMTLVGDVAQTGALAGASTWQEALEPHVGERWRLAELSVNYRTPAEIMALAAQVLAEAAPGLEPPRSVRATGVVPWRRRVPRAQLGAAAAAEAAAELAAVGDGRVAVLTAAPLREQVAAAVTAAVPDAASGEAPDLRRSVVVLSVAQAKGLEFDAVVVVEPRAVLDASPRGAHDLYVALTRATQRLGVVHSQRLPAALEELAPR